MLLSLAQVQLSRGETENAEQSYKRVIAMSDADYVGTAKLRLAQLLMRLGRYAETEATFRDAADSGDDDVATGAAIGLGVLYQRQDRLAESLAQFMQVIEARKWPDLAAVMHRVASVLRRLERYADAEEWYRKAILEAGADRVSQLYYDLGAMFLRCERLEDAESAFQIALDTSQADRADEVSLALATVLSSTDSERAEHLLRALVESDQEDIVSRAATNLAGLLAATKRNDEAEDLWRLAARLGSADVRVLALRNLVFLLFTMRRFPEAASMLTLVDDFRDSPENVNGLRDLAEEMELAGRWADAEEGYRLVRAIASENAQPRIAVALGRSLVEQERWADAEEAFREAARADDFEGAQDAQTAADLLAEGFPVGDGRPIEDRSRIPLQYNLFRTARRLIGDDATREQDVERFAEVLSGVTVDTPNDSDGARALLLKAILFGSTGQWVTSVDELRRLSTMTESGDNRLARALLGLAVADTDPVEATSLLQDVADSGDDEIAHLGGLGLGIVFERRGEPRLAEAAYELASRPIGFREHDLRSAVGSVMNAMSSSAIRKAAVDRLEAIHDATR